MFEGVTSQPLPPIGAEAGSWFARRYRVALDRPSTSSRPSATSALMRMRLFFVSVRVAHFKIWPKDSSMPLLDWKEFNIDIILLLSFESGPLLFWCEEDLTVRCFFVTISPNVGKVSSIVLYVSFSAFRPRLGFRTVSIHSCCISTPPSKQLCVPGDKHSNVLSMQEDSGIGESVNDGKHAVPFCKEMFRAIFEFNFFKLPWICHFYDFFHRCQMLLRFCYLQRRRSTGWKYRCKNWNVVMKAQTEHSILLDLQALVLHGVVGLKMRFENALCKTMSLLPNSKQIVVCHISCRI